MFEQKMIKLLVENPLKSVKSVIQKKFPQGISSIVDPEMVKKIFIYGLNNKNPGVTAFIMDYFDLDANMVLDNNNALPLHCASLCGNLEAIKALFERGANKDAKMKCGSAEVNFWTILHAKGYQEVSSEVQNLISNKEKEPILMVTPSQKDKGPIKLDSYIIHRRKKQAEDAVPLLQNNLNRTTLKK